MPRLTWMTDWLSIAGLVVALVVLGWLAERYGALWAVGGFFVILSVWTLV